MTTFGFLVVISLVRVVEMKWWLQYVPTIINVVGIFAYVYWSDVYNSQFWVVVLKNTFIFMLDE